MMDTKSADETSKKELPVEAIVDELKQKNELTEAATTEPKLSAAASEKQQNNDVGAESNADETSGSKCRPAAGDGTAESVTLEDETVVKSDKVEQKTDTAHSMPDDEEAAEEQFEDAVDTVEKLESTEVLTPIAKKASSAELKSIPSGISQPTSASQESLVAVQSVKAESFEIESSPEKSSPDKDVVPTPVYSRPGPSSSKVGALGRTFPVKASTEIVTVDLDDDDDEDEEAEREYRDARSKRETYDIDEEDDDYYDDPDSDDQDVNRVLQEVNDEINAMDDPDSRDDKMDVSSDEDDYSEDDDEEESGSLQRRNVSGSGASSAKRKHSDYSEDDVVYSEDEDDDFVDEDDDEDVEEVVDLEAENVSKKPPQASVSMGQISVDDESDDDDVQQERNLSHKVKYKTYRKKLVARVLKRTHKILNRRSMHVMEEGSDVLVCSDAKIVSLKSTIGAAVKPSSAEEASATIVRDSDAKETRTKDQPVSSDTQENPNDSIVDAVGVVGAEVQEENKENMTVKDATKEVRRETTDDKVKQSDDERTERRGRKTTKDEPDVIESVMDDIDDIIDEAKYQNGTKGGDFNDELAFQMDADGSQPDDEDHYDDGDDDEDDDEEGAVDLSSSYDANKSDREDYGRQSQTDESDAVEMIDSSPEKSSSVASMNKSPTKTSVPKLESDLSKAIKQENELLVSAKKDEAEQIEKQSDSENPSLTASVTIPNKDDQLEALKEPQPVSRKRRRSVEPNEEREEEPLLPSKKLKRELECNFHAHDLLLKEYIETTTNNSIDDVQKHTDALQVEIRTLNEMIRAKENEWNNMIHLKKVKEEILLRLTRKKHVLNLTDTKLGEESEFSNFDSSNLTNVRSASVGPRPPTPPPEVDARPASVTPMHSNTLNSGARNASGSSHSMPGGRQHFSLPNSKDNSLFAQFNHSNSSVTMVPLSTSSALITSTNTILQSRANMKSAEVAREKPNAVQIQRQILPKPVLSNHQQILNNLAMSAGLTAASITSASGSTSISNSAPTSTHAANAAAIAANNILAGLSAQAAALLNGHHSPSGSNHHHQSANQLQVGRQGVIKDVKSIIADYRQKHPEQVPRRGRRLKNIPNYDGGKGAPGSAAARMTELSLLLAAAEQQQQSQQNAAANLSKGAYPEVTLHPVMNSNSTSGTNAEMNHTSGSHTNGTNQSQTSNSSTNSLLHGILTKSSSRPNATGFTSFSPTLARLLTAPERMSSQAATVTSGALANLQANTGLNLSKSNSEITITPVVASNLQQSLLAHQQQLQEQHKQLQRLREQHFLNMDDEADDSVDRLVIDEGDDHHGSSGAPRADGQHHREREANVVITTRGGNGPDFENDVPECQGCKKREAQFVCAGCGNQWYCSRECQVNAWDDHSEVCTG
ncbi:nestin-like isoform X2 [Wyeomyia smithii]|uniref:nestin-like isoform X2 n=1 Tax=Wyeomyia smithii TaxID=174621 RepID=UPI002467F3FF|nr:nestin-like isoform X2 [Wyeomyia smithii]